LTAKPEPRLADLIILNELVITQSVLRIEGQLTQRPLLASVNLPVWGHSEVVADSVVQLAVHPNGATVSARLTASCGLSVADQYAVSVAKAAQFRPLDAGQAGAAQSPLPLTWGVMVFQWRTTNLAGASDPMARP
jgi:hypothetical protein